MAEPLVACLGVGGGSGGAFRVVAVRNSGFADLTIEHVEGGILANDWMSNPAHLPYTVRARSGTSVFVRGSTCRPRTVTITFAVLGRTSTEAFAVPPSGCGG